jgi:hypothetical protein
VTPEEQEIWRAAYAAAFVTWFYRSEQVTDFNEAAVSVTAEGPITVADLAVLRLREWRAEEEPTAGKDFDEANYKRIWPLR